ncbi:MAG: FAD-dependent oxidoreductase, partial [Thermoleophilia bacterium]|nr:FAD-dependent oxidoreductase [Thermoleophilia bacterium]
VDVDDPRAGRLAIDTGFIVHNRPNYPNVVRLLEELDVATQPSDMSFSVELPTDGFAYRAGNLRKQRQLIGHRSGRRLLAEIVRFLMVGRRDLARGLGDLTLAAYARRRGFSERFLRLYAVPMTAAIWSMPPAGAAEMPAQFVLRFFDNHGLLGLRRHRWRTIVGGGRRYVTALAERLPGPIHLGRPVTAIRRDPTGATVTTAAGDDRFDAVVVATHGDQALRLLADADELERSVLSAFRTTENRATLHYDQALLPSRRSSWASWNVRAGDDSAPVLTYHANSLQRLRAVREYCITLNADELIDPTKVITRIDYRHPAYDADTIDAQRRLPQLDGRKRTYFCGAYQGWGFHEDGAASALRAVSGLGVRW